MNLFQLLQQSISQVQSRKAAEQALRIDPRLKRFKRMRVRYALKKMEEAYIYNTRSAQ